MYVLVCVLCFIALFCVSFYVKMYEEILLPGVNSIAFNKYVMSYITSYHIISYHIISYHIISYHIISYHIILSYHVISNKVFFLSPVPQINIM